MHWWIQQLQEDVISLDPAKYKESLHLPQEAESAVHPSKQELVHLSYQNEK